VTLQGEGKFEITQSKYRLTEDQKQDDGQKLFDFCAECLKTFIDNHLTNENGVLDLKPGETLPLGFTVRPHVWHSSAPVTDLSVLMQFSYPCASVFVFLPFIWGTWLSICLQEMQAGEDRPWRAHSLDERVWCTKYRRPGCSGHVSQIPRENCAPLFYPHCEL